MVLSYPEVRSFVADALAARIREFFPSFDCIAGIATAGIAHGALAADRLGKSYCYVRPEPKKHGLKNQVEGKIEVGDKVVLVEDLISTGKSSFQAVEGVLKEGAEVIGLVALFTYGFQDARKRFEDAGIPVVTLSDFDTLCDVAAKEGYLSASDLEDVKRFAKNPATWKQ
jgi:orotate phosphoribosyltransferase